MYLPTTLYLLATSVALSQAKPASTLAANDQTYWCGKWAGAPNANDVPVGQQLPASDYTRRFFVEPQLQRVPFAPVSASEPKVQIPKIWGNSESLYDIAH